MNPEPETYAEALQRVYAAARARGVELPYFEARRILASEQARAQKAQERAERNSARKTRGHGKRQGAHS